MKRNELNTILVVGGIAGAVLLFKGLKGGLSNLFTGLAQQLNLAETKTEQQSATQYATEPRLNPWNPNYWKQLRDQNKGKRVLTVTPASTEKIITVLYDAIHQWVPVAPDSEKILGVFSTVQYKSQISWLADAFQKKYNKDLLTFLDNGSPFFIGNTGLSDQSMRKLMSFVDGLPTGLVK